MATEAERNCGLPTKVKNTEFNAAQKMLLFIVINSRYSTG